MLNAFQFWRCRKIDDSDTYHLDSLLTVICWGQQHMIYILYFSLTNILVWGVITPAILYIVTKKLFKSKKNKDNQSIRKLIDFITLDYKPEYFYWDLLSYLTKFLLVFMTVLTSSFEPSTQGAFLILFFFFFIFDSEAF